MRNVGFAPAIFMLRIATLILVIAGTLMAGPALAQFGSLFGGGGEPPPRPPADIPNGFPQQPPPPQYPGQTQQYPDQGQQYPDQSQQQYPDQNQPGYPGQAPPAYPGQSPAAYPAGPPSSPSIESQSLPPPPGAAVAPPVRPVAPNPQQPPVPTQHAVAPPPPNSPAPPATAAAPAAPEDDTVVEAPTAHIDNRRAVFAGLDKITGRTIKFDAAIGETVQFGALQVTPRACYTRPATEATNTDAFVEVDEVTLKGDIKRIFTGWMFASSPGLHAVEHPIYDVWLTDCSTPVEAALAEPAAATAPAAPVKPRRGAPPLRARVPPPPPPVAAPLD
jgi:hypothetical protein